MVSIDYLEGERIKLWQRVTELQELIEKKTADYEADARQASKKASEYKNKCEATKHEANAALEEIKKLQQSSCDAEAAIKGLAEESASTQGLIDEIKSIHSDLASRKEAIELHISELEDLFSNYSTFSGKIETLEEIHERTKDFSTKTEATYNQLAARKKEIDQLYYEIIGYRDVDQKTGEESEVQGLKHDLENTFAELKTGFSKFSEDKKKEFTDTINAWEAEYENILQRIQSLLPHALTTGLSFAYSEKKDAEIKEGLALDGVFKKYIKGLVVVSLIPFAVSIYQLIQGVTLDNVILQMPRLVLSILPLYVPILWVAYSANRKMNLSKRLVEEYTHKEVLSKTFEGLAQQIQDLKDAEISADLRTRLLYNILEVSSENPGKLISDYDKSDHPLMDALDKSVKLTNAVDKISKIPGLSKLADLLESRSKEILENEGKKAAAGLTVVEKRTAD